ncbi:MAG: hypothetical protein LBB81_05275 [Treponema sp.]|jgi:hypothetical protein|nr:hypothetical protein [Treponema sp.]
MTYTKKKIRVLLALFFSVSFTLAAQPDASVYVLPVTGTGSKPEDNLFFYRQLVFELTDQNYNLAKTEKDADILLAGSLAPYTENETSGGYVFRLELKDRKTGEILVDGELLYKNPDELNNPLPVLVYTLLSTVPEDSGKNKEWRNKPLYIGASGFWTPRVYAGDSKSTHFVNFGGSITAEFHFTDTMSVEAGLEIASDWVAVSANSANNYRNVLLEIPLLFKYVVKLGVYFMVEPYAGVHINVPLYPTTGPPLCSWLVGFQYGVKAGSGVLYIDPRFAMDTGKSRVEGITGINAPSFQRYIIHIGIGYKFGFLKRKQREQD